MAHSNPAGRPDISVVVVNYRSARLVLRALSDAAAAADGAGLTLEEIVVDGGSGADDVEVLRAGRPGATVLETGANRGFAAGNNAGIAGARGRYVLLVNPDAFAQDGAVARLVAYADDHPEVGVAAPLLRNEDGSPQDNAFRRFPNLVTLFVDFCAPVAFLVRGTRLDPHNVARSTLDAPRPIAHAIGAALLVRADAARAAGPLDESFFLYLEETEWQRRIAAAGWRIDVVPDAVFVHLGGGSSSSYPLASTAYLDSVERYYPRPRLALAVVRVAGLISLVSLRAALLLRLGSPKLRELYETFRQLRAELGRRRATPS
jgi:N-acetylglucosaminyl-diphospho-decaprenol L-rhamnosyltransferase